MDQTQQQWLDYFQSGKRYDIPYTADAARRYEQDIYAGEMAGNFAILDTGLANFAFDTVVDTMALDRSRRGNTNFFGDHPSPSFGLSNDGIHLPTVPLIRWEDIVLIVVLDFRGTWHRAMNASIVPEPQVGSARSKGPMACQLLVRNGPAILGTIDPRFRGIFTAKTTARGQQWGTVDVRLDPALGPEQIVELFYLLGSIAPTKGVPIQHLGGSSGVANAMLAENEIIQLN
jgi:hypothetical protein